MMNRRELLLSLAATAAASAVRTREAGAEGAREGPLRTAAGPDWKAVRSLFPLRRDWVHLSTFLFVSHPKPVADAIERFRRKIDSDSVWIELAALSDAEGRPFLAAKQALARYVGGRADEICLTANTTQALAVAYHGLRIRADQEILTTTHDHYSHHESIRFSSERSGAQRRRIALYDAPASASADEMTERLARAIRPNTRAVGVTWVHSSTGVKTPLDRFAAVVARANAGRGDADRCLLIVDGVHGFGNQDVDVARTGVDFFASGTHKWLFAPRGTGFLWGRADAWSAMRPTIPNFDPESLESWGAWMEDTPLPPMKAGYASPGGFMAYEHTLAIPAAVELHESIGRAAIAARIAELNAQFREGMAKMPKATLHTPRDASASAGISCFEVAGHTPEQVVAKLAERRYRTTTSPYKVSYARVSAGVMNTPSEMDGVLGEIRALAG